MSSLALDEFTLEMRLHFIATMIESLERFKTYDDFFGEVKLAIDEWALECRSNGMDFFVNLLEFLKTTISDGIYSGKEDSDKVSKVLSDYLNLLKTQDDSQSLYEKFYESFQQGRGEGRQLYLQCVSHAHYFIVPVKNVTEIVSNKKIFPLPRPQIGVRGLVSFRGQGIPVVNLTDFGFKQKDESKSKSERTCFVVCDYKESFFALEVDKTDDVLELDASEFQNHSGSTLLSPVADRFVIKNDKSLMVLDIEKLVSYE